MRACKGWYPVGAHHSLSNCTDQAWRDVQGKRRTRTRPEGNVLLSILDLCIFRFDGKWSLGARESRACWQVDGGDCPGRRNELKASIRSVSCGRSLSVCRGPTIRMDVQCKRHTRTRPRGDVVLNIVYLRLDFWEFHLDGNVVSQFDIFAFRFYRVLFKIG